MSLSKNLFKSRKVKIYDVKKEAVDARLHLGNDYRSNMLKNSVSKHIQRNATLSTFIELIQEVLADLVDGVNYLKGYKSYTIKKGDKRVR